MERMRPRTRRASVICRRSRSRSRENPDGESAHRGASRPNREPLASGGEDKNFEGTARPIAGLTVGYLAQEPPLNDKLDVQGNLREAVAPLLEIERRYNELAEAGDMGPEFEKLTEEMAHKEIWELDSHLEQAAEALSLPPMASDVRKL